jgi:hypothetical protein
MDVGFYNEGTIAQFMRKSLCQNDAKLYGHYINGRIGRFRERLSRKFPDSQKNIEQVLYACVTDSIRDIVLGVVGDLTETLKRSGDLIVSGGEAFNMYFEKNDRIITSDIDTKFIPIFKGPSGSLISTKSPKYFGLLQNVKLQIWEALGEIAKRINLQIKQRIERDLKTKKIGRMLGITFPSVGPFVTRRYTLIEKKRQSLNDDSVSLEDVLIDVELFALDLKICYYSVEKKRVTKVNLGGILDIAIMRPFEIGYEIAFTKHQGVLYKDKDTNKMVFNKNILFASRKFLIEDVYLMQLLKLRPTKVQKDRKRMFTFATKVLKIKGLKGTDTILKIFKKSIGSLKAYPKTTVKKRPVFKLKYNLNPEKYKNYTTEPSLEKLVTKQVVGFRGPRNVNIPGYMKTSGQYRFNVESKKWKVNNSRLYIKNEMTHRPENFSGGAIPKVHLRNILYGYNPKRNSWMSENMVNKAAMIPLVGLKNTSFLY